MTDLQPWSYRQFTAALNRAGWKSMGQGCYVHGETGAKFYALSWTKYRQDKYGNGDAWFEFALLRKTPTEAPF